ncbi:MAG: DegV family EDD domain-containing protein [Dehalococcoidia bacterium]|nr:DegV family EDD domain-containing protein [Dehalococcoidia bacterium]
MSRTSVVTEATACLPPDLCAQYSIRTIDPLGADPTPWGDLLAEEVSKGDGVLCLTSASTLSASYQGALEAVHRLQDTHAEAIHVLDTGTTGIGMGLMALEAARLAQQGAGLQEVASRCRQLRLRVQTLGILETLGTLVASGRVPEAARWQQQLGTAYTGVFLLEMGRIELLSTVHSRERSLERMARQITARCQLAPVHAGVMYTTSADEADRLAELLAARVNLVEFYTVPMHSRLAQVAGTGALAIGFYPSVR